MRVCPLLLLRRGVGRLEDEDALDEEQDGGGVEELAKSLASDSQILFHCWGELTGCTLKRIRSWLKTLPQTIAARIQAPACATTPVPVINVRRIVLGR